jgi:peptidoglycan/xylan/chitin deacetylase (PgdA/CDA1 family)
VSATTFRVALTIDTEHPDRPTDIGVTERLIETLAGEGITASFFLQGRWAEAYPDVARSIASAGHLIGNHSHYHARMPLLNDEGLLEDIADAGRAIEATTGVDPRPWFRCPFGAGSTDRRVQAAVAAAGYRHVGWHVGAEDWDPARSATVIEEDLVAGTLAHGDGTVILIHAWPRQTLDALRPSLRRLREAGATFIRIDGLDEVPAAPNWA